MHGVFDAQEKKKFGRTLVLGCPDCAADTLNSHHKKELASKSFVLEAKGIPLRYQGADFDNLVSGEGQEAQIAGRLKDYIDNFSNSKKTCAFIVLSGGYNFTPTACAMLKAAADKMLVARYTSAQDYILAIRASYSSNNQNTEGGILADYADVDFLVLDDLESTRNTQDDRFQLSTLLERRFNNLLPTLIVTKGDNFSLSDRLGGDIFEQITKEGKIFICSAQKEGSSNQVKAP